MKIIECPVCGTDKNSSGQDLGDLRALSLHVAGSAKYGRDYRHRDWVKELLPDTNVGHYTVPEIDSYIRGHVWKALREQEPEEIWEDEDEGEEEENSAQKQESEPYILAYEYLWEIETSLHRFASECLASEYGDDWWKAFPSELQHECLDRAQQDSHKLSLDRYVDFLGLREVFKHERNKGYFKAAFDSLRPEYKDPLSEFHQKWTHVNRIRNNVMHPLKRIVPSEEDIKILEQFLELVRKFAAVAIT